MVKIIVCMKVIIDPEMPFSLFKVDRENRKPVLPSGIPPVFSPFDENALEAALKIKDLNECRVTVLSMGKIIPKTILQKALALGADEAIALEDPGFENLDPFNTAHVISKAIQKIGEYDLIFTGRQSADWDSGLVWAGISEQLDISCITIARKLDFSDSKIVVERCVCDGIEVLESSMPALVSFSNEGNTLRNVSLSALMNARKLEITKWSGSDIGIEKEMILEICDLYEPELGNVDCFLIQGESFKEKGQNLAKKLKNLGIPLQEM